jgi:hypothetical protein
MVGWIVGAAGASIAVVVGDPGFLGALTVFVVSSIVGCLAAALMVASRPERDEASVPADAAHPAPVLVQAQVQIQAQIQAQPSFQGIAASIPAPALAEAGVQRPV